MTSLNFGSHPERVGAIVRRRSRAGETLARRLEAHLRRTGLLPPGTSLTLALSGGLDSTVLLDLVAGLAGRWGWTLSAAHFDHAMRPESGEDAAWVEALCRARAVPVAVGRADRRLRGEAEARAARYAFLHDARRRLGGAILVTAHQADDQAETVLLRLVRGSVPDGLAGVPARGGTAVARPLLPFWRRELEAYAAARGLAHREDPTNRRVRHLRNRMRHRWIPYLEAAAGGEVRRALVRLAAEARRGRGAWARRLDRAEGHVRPAKDGGRLVVAASRLAAYDEPTRAQLLRRWVGALGGELGRGALAEGLRFLLRRTSGGSVDLGGGVVLRREFDAWVLERAPGDEQAPLVVPSAAPGEGIATVGGRRYRVSWGPAARGSGTHATFGLQEIAFPVTVRARRPGDRIARAGGRRSLKRLFVDRGVPRSLRGRWPVAADAHGVLWVPGVERAARARPRDGAAAWTLRVSPAPDAGGLNWMH